MPSVDTFEATGELPEAGYVASISHHLVHKDVAALKAAHADQGNALSGSNGSPENYDRDSTEQITSSPMDSKRLAFDEFLMNGTPNGQTESDLGEVATSSEPDSLATLSDGDNDNAMPNGRNGELDLVSALEPLTGLQVSSADVDNISLLPETCYSPRCTPERTCYAFSCPFKTSNDRLPFIVVEPEASFSMLPKTCYSPRCTPEQICYSFFCPNRAQQEQNQALTFSFMPATCYSPKCTVGGVEVCYAFSCPNREKHQSFRSSSDSATAASIPLDATRPRPRTPTRSWTPSYSVSTINGPQPEEEFVEDDEDSDNQIDRPLTPVLQVDGEPMPEDKSLEPPVAPRPISPWTASYSVTTQAPTNDTPPVGQSEAVVEDIVDDSEIQSSIEHEPSTTSVQDPEIAEVVLNHISDKPSTEWTPSYSVTVQQPGTSTQPKAETVEESPTPEIHVADIDVPLATQAADIQGSAERPPSRTWTPSYSVHTLSKTQEMASAEQTSSDPVIVAPTPRAPPVQIEGLDGHSDPLASTVSATVERPWTPSYSVSTLGNPAPAIVEPSDVAPEASSSNVVSEAPARPWTPSYSVSQQGKPAPVETVDSATTEPPRSMSPYPQSYSVTNQRGTQKPAQELEEAKQPPRSWTPSYSVSTQGIPAPVQMPEVQVEGTPVNAAEVKQIGPFPQSYSVTNQPGSPRVQPVDTVDEVSVPSVNLGWTPSYSVSRQGSPAPPVPALVAEPEPAVAVEQVRSVTDQQASPRIEVTNPVDPAGPENTPKRSWTRSYSVHSQGSVVDLPSHVAAVSESSDDSPADPSTPVTGLDNLPDPEVGQRYWPAWFSASKTDLHEEPMDAPSAEPDPVKPSFDTEEVNADGKGCVIM